MLGYIMAEGRGAGDALLLGLSQRLIAEGWTLAGVVQINRETRPDRHCDMDLQLLGDETNVRISQDLGAGSKGCRLDAQGLAAAVGLVEARLATRPDLLIINKFGQSELDGRGFRPVIGRALVEGIPIVTSINPRNAVAFAHFAGGLAERIEAREDALLAWCRRCRETA